MATIVRISYAVGGAFEVRVKDSDTGISDVVAVDLINQLAVDAAYERRVPVDLELDDTTIVRVVSPEPAMGSWEPTTSGDSITRISTQIQETLVAEVLFSRNPPEEIFSLTRDHVVLLLCHSAFASKHRLKLTKDESSGLITRVVKNLN